MSTLQPLLHKVEYQSLIVTPMVLLIKWLYDPASPRSAMILAAVFTLYHTFLVLDAYTFAVDNAWSFEGTKMLVFDAFYCGLFIIGTIVVVREDKPVNLQKKQANS